MKSLKAALELIIVAYTYRKSSPLAVFALSGLTLWTEPRLVLLHGCAVKSIILFCSPMAAVHFRFWHYVRHCPFRRRRPFSSNKFPLKRNARRRTPYMYVYRCRLLKVTALQAISDKNDCLVSNVTISVMS